MTPARRQRISKKRVVGLTLGLAIIIYAFFRTAEFRRGPVLTLPPLASPVSESRLLLTGQALRIAYLTLNDAPIFTDEAGHFSEPFLLAPGSNIIRLKADDRFGRQTEKLIQIIYVPKETL